MTEAGKPPSRGYWPWWAAVTALLAVSLGWRWWLRGDYFAGYEVLGAAEGKRLLVSEGLWPALHYLTTFRTRYEAMAAQGLIWSFLPGAASLLWPALWWQAAVTLAACVAGALLVARATGWTLSEGWAWAALAWASSYVLCAYSIHGFLWGGVFLPYALVLAGVWGARGTWTSLALVLLGLETAWHTYELGKLVGVLAVLAAVTTAGRPLGLRAAWAAAGLAELYAAFVYWPTGNFGTFVNIGTAALQGASEAESRQLTTLAQAGRNLVHAFSSWTPGRGEEYIDFPTLPALGLVGALVAGPRRKLALAFWLFSFVLLGVLTASQQLLPRRTPLFLWTSLTCLLAGLREQRWLRFAAAVLLLITVAAQLTGLARYSATVRLEKIPAYPIPGMSGGEGAGLVDPPAVRWVEEIVQRVRSGQTIVLFDDLTCYPENLTNPAGVPERLYLRLTPAEWRERLYAISATSRWCRYDCMPAHAVHELPALLPELVERGAVGTFDPVCTTMDQGAELAALRAQFPPPTVLLEDRFEFFPLR
jgi:hypothetical protein